VLCRSRVIFKQYVPNKLIGFGIKIKSCVIIRDAGPHKIWQCIQAVCQRELLVQL
jgi:hypothetical protein